MSTVRPEPVFSPAREWIGLAALLALGCGLRLAFAAAYPTLPFWDYLALVHFATLLERHGLAADGWYWAQFNSGLPMLLSVLFRIFPTDPAATARTATAVVTGLLPAFPFVLWRSVLAFRWRILAGLLLALWPGQILFSGVIAQENWVLLPTIALACLAVRTLLGRGRTHPLIGGLLFACAVAIRQEMAVALLPLVLSASLSGSRPERRRDFRRLVLVLALSVLVLGTQRFFATGRFTLTTDHGALGLFGSFMPGASETGWIDARAYATAVAPSAPRFLFGNPAVLLRMTWEEVKRRPAFHLMRMASWLPRLAVDSDSDDLLWSVGAPQSQPENRRSAAQSLRARWSEPLKWELAAVQGAFLVTVAIGFARRSPAILALAVAVALKFFTHALISPIGRLLVPAIALELLTIPLGAREFARSAGRVWLLAAAGATAAGVFLVLGVPKLSDFVIAHDSPVLPSVRRFELRIEGAESARCELTAGALTGLGPKWAGVRTTSESPSPGETARIACSVSAPAPGDSIAINLYDPYAPRWTGGRRLERVTINGLEVLQRPMGREAGSATVVIPTQAFAGQAVAAVTISLDSVPDRLEAGGRDASLRFEFVRRRPHPADSP